MKCFYIISGNEVQINFIDFLRMGRVLLLQTEMFIAQSESGIWGKLKAYYVSNCFPRSMNLSLSKEK